MIKEIHHTSHDENGTPIFHVNELAEHSLKYITDRKTGQRPDFHRYKEALRALVSNNSELLPQTAIRHKNGRLARKECRVTVENWIKANARLRAYFVQIQFLREHLENLKLKPDGAAFLHSPSKNEKPSSLKGNSQGPKKIHSKTTLVFPGFEAPTAITTSELQFIDYEKTDKLRVLCNHVIKVIAQGKTDSEPDAQLANKCFQELILGLGLIGGVK
jgi:hypothetical protein